MSKETQSRLNDRIRRARRISQLTQADLARKVGVKPSAVAQWEAGSTTPSVTHLISAAQVANVSFEWLATGRGTAVSMAEIPAADLAAFAQDLDEERLLLLFRRIPWGKRMSVVGLLENLLT